MLVTPFAERALGGIHHGLDDVDWGVDVSKRLDLDVFFLGFDQAVKDVADGVVGRVARVSPRMVCN